jgi:hypothetical protein
MLRLTPSLIAVGDESTRQEIIQFEQQQQQQQQQAQAQATPARTTAQERIGLPAATTTTTTTKKRVLPNDRR